MFQSTLRKPRPTEAEPLEAEPSSTSIVGPDGMTDEEYYEYFSNLVESFVQQREAAAPDKPPQKAKRVAESTFQAVAYVLRTYGMKRLNDPWLTNRLANFSDAQIKELVAALGRMQPRFSAITDELIAKIAKLKGQGL